MRLQRIVYLLSDGLFECLGQLVRAGSRAGTAVNAFQTADGFMHIHALHESSYTLGVAVTSADELDRCHDVVFDFYIDELGTDALCLIEKFLLRWYTMLKVSSLHIAFHRKPL